MPSKLDNIRELMRAGVAPEHAVMEAEVPGWIRDILEHADEIVEKADLREAFEKKVEELDLAIEPAEFEAFLGGDCREFKRLSLFAKYHSNYHVRDGGCGLCTKRHWIAVWCLLPGTINEELDIAREVAEGFDRRHPDLGLLSLPAEWWQI